ncbi:DUF3617 domain-containing protein [Peredibacter starrii]|uniref:DUF3617 family protein n=1 Tax=Peredibacter starrii TaxID=28202 RepID=A0AAX4HTZ8_9BACT|nr:DUF3617 family protein [Peredibacter starrii]WPU66876.1 DUF3617 family protein [Peredibacter starrii]
MKFLLLFLVSTEVFAALDMKPGLWAVDMKVYDDNKTVDITKEMKKDMTKLKDQMGKHASIGEDGKLRVCYSEKLLNSPEILTSSRQSNCKTDVVKDTPTLVSTRFKCNDGTSGNSNWRVKNAKNYYGKLHMVTPNGEPTDIKYTGSFISSDCGEIKPLL